MATGRSPLSLVLLPLAALLALAAPSGHVLADPIYFDFQSQVSPGDNTGQSSNSYSVSFAPVTPAGGGEAGITAAQGTHIAGSGTINIANLGWDVQADQSNPTNTLGPSTFNAQPFKLALTLTDEASHAQGTLNFQGTFGGVVPTYTGGTLSFTPSVQSLVLGQNTYTVDLSQQTSWVAQQTWMMMGAFGGAYQVPAQVTVQSLPVQAAPEPASLTLAGLGLSTILGGCLYRRCSPR